MKTLNSVGILLFDDVELLDFAGPLQVFSAARYVDDKVLPVIETIGASKTISVAKCDLRIEVHTAIDNAGPYDLFLIPGGMGTRALIKDEEMLSQIDRIFEASSVNCSVCTGSLVLAQLGKLSGMAATTHYAATDLLTKLDNSIVVDRSRRVIDHGDVVISEGVSAGIDMSFHLLTRYFGREFSDTVRRYIEYYPLPYDMQADR